MLLTYFTFVLFFLMKQTFVQMTTKQVYKCELHLNTSCIKLTVKRQAQITYLYSREDSTYNDTSG